MLGPASGVCLALGPVFLEVAHRGPSLNWSRGGISPLGELLTFVLLSFCGWVGVCVSAEREGAQDVDLQLHEDKHGCS